MWKVADSMTKAPGHELSEHYKKTAQIIWEWFEVADKATVRLLYRRLDAAGLLFNADLATRLFDAEAVLAELVRLKDGPRDKAYEEAKLLAWSRARAVLAQIPGKPGQLT